MPITEPRTPDCHFLRLLNMNKKLLFYLALAIVLLDFYVKSFKSMDTTSGPPLISARPQLYRWILHSSLDYEFNTLQ